ncbi:polysaccharide biosynthesis protein [Aureibacillus halotolerans]|uniref:FlaA1/EpsC-like NDP-sugar epimerase n=1 Tax=Aureibacillus halotolerans TaxID=1508390 RepID=A0A4R6U1U9_9BACI|nr:nucleoside-diphosphate sugar epimerase/dehydratase [Aureibacillus halotolerans]TDQ38653.1 FlaA1/EpsC-like NDP-sugar epimerase [Aureibacillus halotolerans]
MSKTIQKRLLVLIFFDSLIVSFSIYMSHFFLNPYVTAFDFMMLVSATALLFTHHLFSWIYKMYKKVWQYASLEELLGLIKVVSLSIGTTAIVQGIFFGEIYQRALIITWMLHILLLGGVRFMWRYYKTNSFKTRATSKKEKANDEKTKTKTIIIGAGSSGQMLARQIKKSADWRTELVGFVDDNERLHTLTISGYPVFGEIRHLTHFVEKYHVTHVVIAMPSASRERIKDIITLAQACVKNVQTLPMIEDIALGNISVKQIRDVSIEDLLGREPVELDITSISREIQGETILVTGAGGSIGSEICRQLLPFNPAKLVLLGHGENSIYAIHMELGALAVPTELVTVIADIQDKERMMDVMFTHQPAYVYHAAAHKHVPLMEENPREAVKNNVLGTRNVAEAAGMSGVKTFVLVSSDKAVNPTNVMGATKRLAEMVVQTMNQKSPTKFVAVRFGNVLGSRGSVIPLFKKQIEAGGPVTVTHPDMTRYFMTIPEASRLVLQAGALADGGEIFVLDMGESVKIVDLAKNLIRLSGFSVEEVGLTYTGIRPGEKMFEELLNEAEIDPNPVFPKIFVGRTVPFEFDQVETVVSDVNELEYGRLREILLGLANSKNTLEMSR